MRRLTWILGAILLMGTPAPALAHTAIIDCMEADGECQCQGFFSDMSPATGARVTVIDDTGQIIRQGEIDVHGEFSFPLPNTHYRVYMHAGPGHNAEPWDPTE
jgi:hypothetical protein